MSNPNTITVIAGNTVTTAPIVLRTAGAVQSLIGASVELERLPPHGARTVYPITITAPTLGEVPIATVFPASVTAALEIGIHQLRVVVTFTNGDVLDWPDAESKSLFLNVVPEFG